MRTGIVERVGGLLLVAGLALAFWVTTEPPSFAAVLLAGTATVAAWVWGRGGACVHGSDDWDSDSGDSGDGSGGDGGGD